MANEAHTRGPWVLMEELRDHAGTDYLLASSDGETHITSFSVDAGPEHEANARLIAAAPLLLEALQELEQYLRDTPHHNAVQAAKARAAIAAATNGGE